MKSVLRSLLLFVCLAVPASVFASGTVTPSNCPLVAPAMDGVMSAHEWDGARTIDIAVNVPGGGTAPARLFLLNDANNLYVALRIQRSANESASFDVFIDANGDGTASAGDDGLLVTHSTSGTTVSDVVDYTGSGCPAGSLCSGSDSEHGGTNDARGAFGMTSTTMVFETAKPLYSTDPADAYMEEGETIGMTFFLRLMAPGAVWPTGYGDTSYPAPPTSGIFTNFQLKACL